MKQHIALAVLLLQAGIVLGQTSGQDHAAFNLTLNHVALSVKDVDRSAAFYGNILQFQEITNRTKMDGIRWFSVGEGRELHLISILKQDVSVNKAVHLAFTTNHFDSFVTMLENMNVVYSDWPGTPNKINIRADGVKQIYFQDPDGYWVEVNTVAQK